MRRSTAVVERVVALPAVVLTVVLTVVTTLGLLDVQRVDASPVPDPDQVELVVFHGDGCPHCASMLEFLDELEARYDGLVVTDYEVWYDQENLDVFAATLAALGEEPDAVPTVVVDGVVIVGHSDAIESRIETIVDDLLAGLEPVDAGAFLIDVPFVGSVDVGSGSLIGATALIALVDGVNPCSLWVLSMLMALVVHSGSRRRVFAVGGVFLLITSVMYGLYMIGAYSALSVIGQRVWIRIAVALVAGTFGVLHIKEHWTTKGPSVTIGSEHKPGLFAKMRSLADTDRSLPATLGGTAVLAVGVSLLETPCTAGLPLLWTNLIADREVPTSGAVALFLLYLLVFLIDELVIFGAAVLTLRAAKMQEHHGRALQLIGGTLMLTLAVAMIVAPSALESIGGTAIVFGIAGGVTAAVLVVEAWWRHRHPVTRQQRRARSRARA
jgi:cytochrome c biogenesis protein CcdA/glutaredoxin